MGCRQSYKVVKSVERQDQSQVSLRARSYSSQGLFCLHLHVANVYSPTFCSIIEAHLHHGKWYWLENFNCIHQKCTQLNDLFLDYLKSSCSYRTCFNSFIHIGCVWSLWMLQRVLCMTILWRWRPSCSRLGPCCRCSCPMLHPSSLCAGPGSSLPGMIPKCIWVRAHFNHCPCARLWKMYWLFFSRLFN